jgi:uncharacterized membrane protein HdeD (DUF308 family)
MTDRAGSEFHPGMNPEALLTQNWWAVALRGAAALAFGILALVWPGATLLTLVILLSVYFLLDGNFAIIAGVRAARRHERWWPFVLEGVANIAAGIIVLLLPGISILALMYLLAIWSIITGGLMVFGAMHIASVAPRWLLVVSGALSVLLGVVMIASPVLGLLALVAWVAMYGIAVGILLLSVGFWLRSHHHPHATPQAA